MHLKIRKVIPHIKNDVVKNNDVDEVVLIVEGGKNIGFSKQDNNIYVASDILSGSGEKEYKVYIKATDKTSLTEEGEDKVIYVGERCEGGILISETYKDECKEINDFDQYVNTIGII